MRARVFGLHFGFSGIESVTMIVCADDFGLAQDIDEAILELARNRRLSAVSCLVLLERCTRESLARLLPCQSSVDLGLHFCLTRESQPLSRVAGLPAHGDDLPAFGPLLRLSLLRQLRPKDVRTQLAAQYELFVAKSARRPDYIDGHLHVHQLPIIREVLVDFVLSLPPESRPYIRNTQLPLKELWQRRLPWKKAALVGGFGRKMKHLLEAGGLDTNEGFAGIYDFRRADRYPDYFSRFVDCLSKPTSLLVVHPGTREAWRRREAETLQTFAFPAGSPRRFREIPSPVA